MLTAHPDVRDAAVIGAADLEWGERIVAFVVPRDGAVLDLDRLRAYAGSELRASRMPSEIILRGELPYNATGKLLQPATADRVSGRKRRPPQVTHLKVGARLRNQVDGTQVIVIRAAPGS